LFRIAAATWWDEKTWLGQLRPVSNGTPYPLQVVRNKPGTYVDMANDEKVYRKSGLGSKGVIYQFPRESIYLYY
jgi:hypothetical protein